MNNDKLKKKVLTSINGLIYEKGYAAPVDVLLDIEEAYSTHFVKMIKNILK